MIDREHELPVSKQAKVLEISWSSVYYLPQPAGESDLKLMRRIDELHMDYPFAGAHMLRAMLNREGRAGGPQACGHADEEDGD
jgi:putative transposase